MKKAASYETIRHAAYINELNKIADDGVLVEAGPGNIDSPDIPEVADVPLEQRERKHPFRMMKMADDADVIYDFPLNFDTSKDPDPQTPAPKKYRFIKQSAISDETVKTYDPENGPPPKPIKRESVHIPKVYSRDDAGEQGFSILS